MTHKTRCTACQITVCVVWTVVWTVILAMAAGVETVGAETDGVKTDGVETDGVETVGVETVRVATRTLCKRLFSLVTREKNVQKSLGDVLRFISRFACCQKIDPISCDFVDDRVEVLSRDLDLMWKVAIHFPTLTEVLARFPDALARLDDGLTKKKKACADVRESLTTLGNDLKREVDRLVQHGAPEVKSRLAELAEELRQDAVSLRGMFPCDMFPSPCGGATDDTTGCAGGELGNVSMDLSQRMRKNAARLYNIWVALYAEGPTGGVDNAYHVKSGCDDIDSELRHVVYHGINTRCSDLQLMVEKAQEMLV